MCVITQYLMDNVHIMEEDIPNAYTLYTANRMAIFPRCIAKMQRHMSPKGVVFQFQIASRRIAIISIAFNYDIRIALLIPCYPAIIYLSYNV